MAAPTIRAVLLDVYGTLLWLDDPVGVIGAALAGAGCPNPADAVATAFRAEVAHYQAHQDSGSDAAGLGRLRRRCAGVLAAALPNPPPLHVAEHVLAHELRYVAAPEAGDALDALRARGLAIGVVSNWDCGLEHTLAQVGLRERVDVVGASAVVGARKPDPAIFLHVLEALGVAPREALHCGDRADVDCVGAEAAGIRPVLVHRRGGPAAGWETVADLSALVALVSGHAV